MASRSRRWRRRALVAFGLVLAVPLGLFVYSRQFDPEAEDFAGQRALLASRLPDGGPSKVDAAQLLEDVRRLAAPEMEGRAVGTPGGLRARQYLLQRFDETGLAPVGAAREQAFQFQPSRGASFWKSPPPVPGVNVLGSIRGSAEPGQVLLVTAHYDHEGIRDGVMYPGADDNASGVAAMLAVARHFRAHPPRRTLLFVAFDGEESGLEGARAFLARPPVPRDAMLAVVNFDMVSRNPDNEIVVSGLFANPQLRALLEEVRARARPTLLFGHDHPRPFWDGGDWTLQSDHGVFHEAGMPFLYLGVEDHADYHQPTDTFERVDRDFFVGVADAAIEVVAALDAAPAAQLRRQP